jgi:hypothetical protein
LAVCWAHPHLYLDPQVRTGISAFVVADQGQIASGVQRLQEDLTSGELLKRDGHHPRPDELRGWIPLQKTAAIVYHTPET